MPANTTMIHTRMPVALKNKAEKILGQLGITSAEAIRMLYAQIINNKGIPYEMRIPNAKTKRAIENVLAGKNLTSYNSVDELFKDLDS